MHAVADEPARVAADLGRGFNKDPVLPETQGFGADDAVAGQVEWRWPRPGAKQ